MVSSYLHEGVGPPRNLPFRRRANRGRSCSPSLLQGGELAPKPVYIPTTFQGRRPPEIRRHADTWLPLVVTTSAIQTNQVADSHARTRTFGSPALPFGSPALRPLRLRSRRKVRPSDTRTFGSLVLRPPRLRSCRHLRPPTRGHLARWSSHLTRRPSVLRADSHARGHADIWLASAPPSATARSATATPLRHADIWLAGPPPPRPRQVRQAWSQGADLESFDRRVRIEREHAAPSTPHLARNLSPRRCSSDEH